MLASRIIKVIYSFNLCNTLMKYKTLFVYIMMKNTETKKMLEKVVMEESLLISPSETRPCKADLSNTGLSPIDIYPP